jgi:hypothetical protein
MMPYRALPSEEAASYADQQSADQLPPQTAEFVVAGSRAQRRSWQSFWAAFSAHAFILAGLCGVDLSSNPETVWRALRYSTPERARRKAADILVSLRKQSTSFTKSYLSLKPWWEGGLARGP